MKRFLLFAMTIVFAMQLSAQETTYAVGEYGTGTSSYVPLDCYYDYSYSQSIYPADSLQPGMITAISYKYAASNSETIPSVIYMGEVTRSAFSGSTDWVPVSELTQVFSGSVTYSQGWIRIELDEPYLYTGGNLVVAYVNERGSYTASRNFNTFSINSASLYKYRDESIISPSNPPSGSVVSYVPSTKFHFSGEAVDVCYPPMNLTVSNITSTDAEITWTTNENSTSSDYGIAYKTQDSEEWIELDNVSGESTTLSDLSPLTRYDVKVWTICSDGNSWAAQTNFLTNVDESMIQTVPYYEDFDNADDIAEWRITNGTVTNKWYHGTIENNTMIDEDTPTDGGAMYISNDGGTTNAYTVDDATSIAYFSTFIGFGEGPDFKLTFDRKQIGENGWDYVRVYLMDVDAELSNTTLPDASYAISSQLGSTENEEGIASWVTEEIFIPNTYANTTKKLVFMWRNDNGDGENPPAAIDNIAITELSCGMVSDLTVQTEDMDGTVNANVTFTDNNSNTSEYMVEYKLETETEWMTYTSSDNPVVVPDLLYGSRYQLRITAVCDDATSFVSETVIFNTPCAAIVDLPYVTGFEETFQAADGVIGNATAPLCWYNINGGDSFYSWSFSSYSQNVYEGSQTLYLQGTSYSYYTYDFSEWFISPVFELTGNERLNFKAKATTSTNSPVLKIYAKDVTDGDITSAADTSSFTLVETINLTVSNNFEDYEIYLSDYSGNTRFALVVDQMSSSFSIDSLVVSAIPDCPDVYGLAVSPASSESVSVSFNTSNSNGSGWVIAYGQAETAEDFDPESAEFTANVSDAEEVPYTIDGLNTGETYYFAVQQDCGGAFTAPVAVTLPVTVTLPYEQNFDDPENMAEIIIDNNTATNQWHYGTAVNNTVDESGTPTMGGAMYISDDNGVSNNYDGNSTSTAYFSTVIEFGEGSGYMLTFDRKQEGEADYYSIYDYSRVYLMDLDQELSSSIPNSSYAITSELTSTNSAWVTDTVILDGSYANTVKRLVFMWRNDNMYGYQPPAAIDNIKLEARNCVEVTDLTLTTEDAGESANITVSFTDPNEAGNYIIEYKSANDTEWTVLTDISDNTYTIEELPYATQYYVRVQAVCSDESSSIYVQATIYTSCTVLPLPWTETFDTDVITNPCWSSMEGSFPSGTIQASSLSSADYGWEHTTDPIGGITDGRMAMNVYYINQYWLITPSVDLGDGSTTCQIAADVLLRPYFDDADPTYGSDDIFAILVSTDNGQSWSSDNAIIYKDGDEDLEHDFSDLGRTPTRVIFKLVDADDNPITGHVKFAFFGGSTIDNADNNVYIDNIEVGEWSECQTPSALTVSNIGYNSATVSFVEIGEATEWEYVLVEEGGDMETADAVAVYENPIELTDLESLTTYTIAVRSVCSDGSTTSWSPSLTFTTKCPPVELPWTEGFEDITAANELPACMEATNLGDDVKTYTSAQSNDYNQVARTGSKFASFMWGCDDYIFTPGFELTAGNEYTFSFWYITDGRSGWTTLEAKLCSGQTAADAISTIGTAVSSPVNTTYQEYTGTFIPDEDGVYYIAIYCNASYSPYYLSIDDLSLTEGGEVIEPEPCAEPTNLTVTNITETTAELTWTAGGSESSWQVRLGEDGEAVDVTATSHTFTELTAGTQYTAYVRANCGENYSSWVSVAFTTASEGVVNPVVTTVAASNVTETEATLNATVVEGTETITARGFKYKTTEATAWTDVAATGTTTLTATLTDLTPATSYEFKAYVTVGTEEFEGAVLTFTTESEEIEIVMGTVETNEASNVNDHTAVLNGTLTSNGGDDSYTVGFLMSTMEDFDMETPNVVNLPATENAGALTANATDLESGTNYFFRAYITNDAGTAYGDIKTFVTTSGLSDAEGGLSAVIYPNPASGKATIEIEGLNESARLIVTDLQGRVLSSDDLRSGAKTYEMDLTGLASGVYYIRIVTDNAVLTRKLIVK